MPAIEISVGSNLFPILEIYIFFSLGIFSLCENHRLSICSTNKGVNKSILYMEAMLWRTAVLWTRCTFISVSGRAPVEGGWQLSGWAFSRLGGHHAVGFIITHVKYILCIFKHKFESSSLNSSYEVVTLLLPI